MKKHMMLLVLGVTLVTLFSLGAVQAHEGNKQGMSMMGQMDQNERGIFHEEMEKIMESGTYSDLESFREKKGMDIMRWVTGEESFKTIQEMHKSHEEAGLTPGFENSGMHGMKGMGCQ